MGEKVDEKEISAQLFLELQQLKVSRNEFIKANNSLREKVVNIDRDFKAMTKHLQKWN